MQRPPEERYIASSYHAAAEQYNSTILTSMKNEDLLKRYIAEAVGAGPQYQRKEIIRQRLQDMLEQAVISGEIQSQKELMDWHDTVGMAVQALRGVPYEIWKRKLGQ